LEYYSIIRKNVEKIVLDIDYTDKHEKKWGTKSEIS